MNNIYTPYLIKHMSDCIYQYTQIPCFDELCASVKYQSEYTVHVNPYLIVITPKAVNVKYHFSIFRESWDNTCVIRGKTNGPYNFHATYPKMKQRIFYQVRPALIKTVMKWFHFNKKEDFFYKIFGIQCRIEITPLYQLKQHYYTLQSTQDHLNSEMNYCHCLISNYQWCIDGYVTQMMDCEKNAHIIKNHIYEIEKEEAQLKEQANQIGNAFYQIIFESPIDSFEQVVLIEHEVGSIKSQMSVLRSIVQNSQRQILFIKEQIDSYAKNVYYLKTCMSPYQEQAYRLHMETKRLEGKALQIRSIYRTTYFLQIIYDRITENETSMTLASSNDILVLKLVLQYMKSCVFDELQ